MTENSAPVITAPRDTTYAQGESVAAFDFTVTDADGDTPTVTVTGLPSGLSYASGQVSGAVAQDAAAQDYTVTITANDGVNADVTATFTITVTDVNFAPAITDPGDKSYAQGASITAFAITVTDADGDTPTVTVTGLPSGLSYASGQVSGAVAQDAAAQDYTVTITANDGVNDAVTATFTITVTDVSFAPVITDPGNKTYAQGASITAFAITVTDADGETPTVTVTGLPSGLAYANGQVSGAVAQDAAVQDHTATITANDGTNDAVTATFTITVTDVKLRASDHGSGGQDVRARGVDHGVRHHGDGRGRRDTDSHGHGAAIGAGVHERTGQRRRRTGRGGEGPYRDQSAPTTGPTTLLRRSSRSP